MPVPPTSDAASEGSAIECPPKVDQVRYMPSDFSISLDAVDRVEDVLNAQGPRARRHAMEGFEDVYGDVIEYVLRATHRIWEEKAVGYLYEHYAAGINVRGDSGTSVGRDGAIAATTQALAAFPDCRVHADEIIWCGDENVGFWTSHRFTVVGHNTGWTEFGPPTGRAVSVWGIANCHSYRNQVVGEVIANNNGAMVQQLGRNIFEVARSASVVRPLLHGVDTQRTNGQAAPEPGSPPVLDPGSPESFARGVWVSLWNWRLVNTVDDWFAPTFRFNGPTDRESTGIGPYKSYLLEILAMFPDLHMLIDDCWHMGNASDGFRVVLQWTAVGHHRGWGPYGAPTGRPAEFRGITHLYVDHSQVCREWTVWNELEVLQALLGSSQGDGEGANRAGLV